MRIGMFAVLAKDITIKGLFRYLFSVMQFESIDHVRSAQSPINVRKVLDRMAMTIRSQFNRQIVDFI